MLYSNHLNIWNVFYYSPNGHAPETKIDRSKNILLTITIFIISILFQMVICPALHAATPMVAAGDEFTAALQSDGTVVAVGNNDWGQCEVSGWTDIVQIAAGWAHIVGLKSDGTVQVVGVNCPGAQCDVNGWTDIVQVDAGPNHTVGLKSDGTVQIAGGFMVQQDVSEWSNIVQVAAGQDMTVGLKSDGTVVVTDADLADDIGGWDDIVQIAIGDRTIVGLKGDGKVLAVGGIHLYGELNVSGWSNIVQVSSGGSFISGLKSDGTVIAVGNNNYGQLNVNEWTDIVQIDTGSKHTVGLKSDGTVVAVGFNASNECDVSGWNGITQIDAGAQDSVGLKTDGTLVAVGYNLNSRYDFNQWSDIVQVSIGRDIIVGLKSDGTIVSVLPVMLGCENIEGWSNIVQVDTGIYHAVGLKSDGTVVAGGCCVAGDCDVDEWNDIFQVTAGGQLTLGLRSDHTAIATGNNSGLCNEINWNDIVQAATCGNNIVGLKSDGAVIAVGDNNEFGQLNVSGWTDIIQVSSSTFYIGGRYSHTVGLKSDGTVVATGWNEYGQCDVSGWTDIVQVSAGIYNTLGLKSDGTVVSAGWFNQLDVGGWSLGSSQLLYDYDKDDDGIYDYWEYKYFGDTSRNGFLDYDSDGLTDLEEYQNGSNPKVIDTDGDGLADYDEVKIHGTDPAEADTDNDDLGDNDELNAYQTDPNDFDSDDDGVSDGDEVDNGTGPNNASEYTPTGTGVISGTIYQDDATTPITGIQIQVDVYEGDPLDCDGTPLGSARSNPMDGTYAVSNLAPGSKYYAKTNNLGESNYVNEWWSGSLSDYGCAAAQEINVISDNKTTGIDFDLQLGGNISGRVTDSNGLGISGINIVAFGWTGDTCEESQQYLAFDVTDSDGYYTIYFYDLPPEDVYLKTYADPVSVGNFVNEWYGGAVDCANAVLVPVPSSDIDFVLDQAGIIEGRVTNLEGIGISYMLVQAYTAQCEGQLAGYNFTDSDGYYTIYGLPIGESYYVRTAYYSHSYMNEWYGDISADACDGSTPVEVSSTSINFELDKDSDGDGIPDEWESSHGLNPNDNSDAGIDSDSDGLTNLQEYLNGTDPTNSDTETDGMPDGWEINNGLNPDDNSDAGIDSDSDGLINLQEYQNGTDPNDFDSDDDSVSDGSEVDCGTDPNDPSDYPAEGTGVISGTVYESDGITPIPNLHVYVVSAPCSGGIWLGGVNTNEFGEYTIYDLPEGNVYVRACADCSSLNYVSEWYDNEIGCNDAVGITVIERDKVSGIDFELEDGGSISGKVYESDGITPIANLHVWASSAACNGDWLGGVNTNELGEYTISGLPAGEVYVQACGHCSKLNYVSEWYNNIGMEASCDTHTPVSVSAGADHSGINFVLEEGGSISGAVYGTDGVTPIPNMQVYAQTTEPCGGVNLGYNGTTNELGEYTIYGLPVGEVFVQTCTNCSGLNYVDEWYNNIGRKDDCNNVTGINVIKGGNIPDIDFELEKGGSISGTVYRSDAITPIDNMHLYAQSEPCESGNWLWGVMTNKFGEYTILGMPEGNVYIRAFGVGRGYVSEFYDDALECFSGVDPVGIIIGEDTGNIDFQLEVDSDNDQISDDWEVTYFGDLSQGEGEDFDGDGINNKWENRYGTNPALWDTDGDGVSDGDELRNGTDPNNPSDYTPTGTGVVSGTVRDTNGNPVTGVQIKVSVSEQCGSLGFGFMPGFIATLTNPDNGTYVIVNLQPGTDYYLNTDNMNQSNYVNEHWTGDLDDPSSIDCGLAVPITVNTDEYKTGIDFELALGGSISGIVSATNGGTPIANITLTAVLDGCNANLWLWLGSASTNASGEYTIYGLPEGDVYVQASANTFMGQNYISEWYDDWYNTDDCINYTPVTVTAGADHSGIDFALEEGGIISGTVYKSDGITPIIGTIMYIQAIPAISDFCGNTGVIRGGGFGMINSSDGTYRILGLPPGEYYLGKWFNYSGSNYVNEWWADPASVLDCESAQTVVITSYGQEVSGKDFQLDLGGSISGKVLDQNGDPITNVPVFALIDPCDDIGVIGTVKVQANNNTTGEYTIYGLPAGDVYVYACPSCNTALDLDYADEWYDDERMCGSATPVTVIADQNTGNIDFQLGTDADDDGMPDDWEITYFGNTSRDGTGDYDNDGRASGAYSFNGSGNYIKVDQLSISLPASVSVWFKSSVINNLYDTIFGWNSLYPFNGIQIYAKGDGKIVVRMNDQTEDMPSMNNIDGDGRWHHIVLTREGNTLTLYVDGVFNNSKTVTTTIGTTDNILYIGTSFNISTQSFAGVIDDVYIYDHALSQSEVEILYFNENEADMTGLIAYYPFNGNANDESGNGHNGTVYGATLTSDHKGLTDLEEFQLGTDPTDADTDNDGMSDGWEVQYGLNPLVNDASEDADGDGYSNIDEYQGGTDPNNRDDFPNQPPTADAGIDQIVDEGDIVTLDGTNSADPDAGDGIATYLWTQISGTTVNLSNSTASQPTFTAPDVGPIGTSLTFQLTVTDNHGLQGEDTCIVNILDVPDNDADGMPDAWEMTYFSDTSRDGTGDYDSDTLTDLEEYGYGTDPTLEDTDDDGMSDDWEITYGLDPLVDDASLDPDGDGYSNLKEYQNGTDPNVYSNLKPYKPVLLAPANGATDVSLTTTLKTGSFADPDPNDSHGLTQWQISKTIDFSPPVVLEVTSDLHLISLTVPDLALLEGTPYYWRVRFYDNHSNMSDWSDAYSFTTMTTMIDTNKNGIPDDKETDKDVDGDGTPDNEQEDIVKSMNTVVDENLQIGVSRRGAEDVVESIESIDSIDPNTISKIARPDDMILGLFAIKLKVAKEGDAAKVKIHFSNPAPADAKWYMYNPIDRWSDYSEAGHVTFSADGMSVDLELKDGGYGDADGVANGIIVDPGGFGMASWLGGKVTDALTGKKIKKAEVSIKAEVSMEDLILDTEPLEGNYVTAILAGTYSVTVKASGYETIIDPEVTVEEGIENTRDYAMTPAGVEYIDLDSGWNLTSFKKQPENADIAAVLEDISYKVISVWAYVEGQWQVYDPANPGFSDLTKLDAGKGYWMNMKQEATLIITGFTASKSINLSTGWKLVGYSTDMGQLTADALASIVDRYISIWAYIDGGWKVYDPNNPGFSDLTDVQPGYGYWINAKQDCTWTIP